MSDDVANNEKANSSEPALELVIDPPDEKFLIVGIGASAGGITALREFFSKVKIDSGMAYVVILHMSPEHESRLAEVLQVATPIPVTQVVQREEIKPNHVYVISPNQTLAINDGHLELTQMISLKERRSPVDLFFRTLAEANEARAVAVILSGTGANGSIGLKRIKEYGGIALAQDPSEAQFTDMPMNAIATGMVDYVLPAGDIALKISSYDEHRGALRVPEPLEESPQSSEQALIDIFTQLRVRTGHDFSNYKRATILRRIERRIGLNELSELEQYSEYLREHPQEVHLLMKDLLISVTNFFRDQESLETLITKAVPRILEVKSPAEPFRVWVAGCATGEEAYSLAMLLSEQLEVDGRPANLQLFATDLDHEAIQVARDGFYKYMDVSDISPERLRRFFNHENDGYRVRKELREQILFAVHNVIKDPPFSHLDLVSCRNLLIYLNRTAQGRVLEVLHFALNPTGYLVLGASESTEGASDLFAVVDKDHHIFRSRPVPPRAFPVSEVSFRPRLLTLIEREKTVAEKNAIERLSYADLHQRLLEQYGPPSVIINENYDIVHLSERAGRYMQMAGGEPTHNLLRVIRPELRLELRTALYQAVHDRINVDANGLSVSTEEGLHTVNILVRPVLHEGDVQRGFVLVLFEEQKLSSVDGELKQSKPMSSEPVARRLEEELVHAKTQLRATVEQYEVQQEELRASNEELQAMNEELRSAAEELETSKEELQSVNEELTTVNQELKIKIEELSLANNNFQNLMNSTSIGTVFLDRSLRVRQFTPSARETFNLIQSDVGRPLWDITSKLDDRQLTVDVETVLNKLNTIEREVKTKYDRTFIMRVSPYRTFEDRIDGVVITLVDVTELARAREDLRVAREDLEARVEERTRELNDTNETLKVEMSRRAEVEHSRLQLLSELVTAQEDERRRLALDLHDQLGQQLTALRIQLETLKPQIQEVATSSFDDLQNLVKQLDADVDFLAWQLRPLVLDDLGLAAAITNYVKQWSEHFDVTAEFRLGNFKDERLSSQMETNLYRIVQEALNNCAKHAKCSRAEILLERIGDDIVLIIEDDGVGFKPDQLDQAQAGWGILGMRERARLLKGTVEIESSPSRGTTIYVRMPIMDAIEGGQQNEDHPNPSG